MWVRGAEPLASMPRTDKIRMHRREARCSTGISKNSSRLVILNVLWVGTFIRYRDKKERSWSYCAVALLDSIYTYIFYISP